MILDWIMISLRSFSTKSTRLMNSLIPFTTTSDTTDVPEPIPTLGPNSFLRSIQSFLPGTVGVCFSLGTLAIFLNSIIVWFYSKSTKRNLVSTLYTVLGITDFLTGLSSILLGSYLLFRYNQITEEWKEGKDIRFMLMMLVFVTSSLTTRVSAYYTTMLSIVRSINIASPFHAINYDTVMIFVVFYPVIWTGIITSDVILSTNITRTNSTETNVIFSPAGGKITLEEILRRTELSWKVQDVLLSMPLVIPSLITLGCTLHQIFSLMMVSKRSAVGCQGVDESYKSQLHRSITTTIVMITTTFFVCNTATIAFSVTALQENYMSNRDSLVACLFFSYIIPYLNSVFNPVILILRGELIRSTFKRSITNAISNVLHFLPRSKSNKLTQSLMKTSEINFSTNLGTSPKPGYGPSVATWNSKV